MTNSTRPINNQSIKCDHTIADGNLPWTESAGAPEIATSSDIVPLCVAVFDATGDLVAINHKLKALTPQDTPPTPTRDAGMAWRHLEWLGADPAVLSEGLSSILNGGNGHFEHHFSSHSQPGEPSWLRCVITPMVDHLDDSPKGAAMVLTDITREMNAERRARHIERHSAEMLTHLSHELRTPLNAVIGFSEMMIRQSWGCLGHHRYNAYARDIHASGKHLLALVNQILDFAKAEAGKQPIVEQEADLGELARRSAELIADLAERAGLTLVHALADDLPRLRIDPRMVAQILINLLSNAVKFTPTGGTITIRTGLDADGHPFAAVADTGMGIAPEHFAQVLEPFGQVGPTPHHTELGLGTGLGLPLCKRFIELHGGSLHLASAPGEGTTVTARFPRSRLRAHSARSGRASPLGD